MASSVNITHPSRMSWSPPRVRVASSPTSSSTTSSSSPHRHGPSPSTPRLRRLRLSLLFAVIGIYAISFIVWCTCFQGEHGRGLAALFPKGYDESLNRMLALLTNKNKSKSAKESESSAAAADPAAANLLELECLGWRHTHDCDPNSFVLQSFNRTCDFHIRGGQSGYCEMRNRSSGAEVRVMKTSCTSILPDVLFTCNQALDFVHFREETEAVVVQASSPIATASATAADSASEYSGAVQINQSTHLRAAANTRISKQEEIQEDKSGILMVIYPKLLVSAYASVRTLRATHNCSLPIEIWYLASEMGPNATQHAILSELVTQFAPVSLVAIREQDVAGFNSKVHAILHTNLTDVLFLDADNVPVKDPTYLFETPEFKEKGAMFWPDFWHPAHSIFNINKQSLIWELLGLPFVDMFEQESGQLLINKRKSVAALQLLELFAFRRPSLFENLKLAWGDKDLFRLAWLKTNTSFHMIRTPPGIAGSLVQSKFCGMTMAQFDPRGDVIFLHRNAMKLNGGRPIPGKDADSQIWTHLQTFAWKTNNVTAKPRGNSTTTDATTSSTLPSPSPLEAVSLTNTTEPELSEYERLKEFFQVSIYNGAPQFSPTQWCYGKESPPDEPNFKTIPWSETPFPGIEIVALAFAKDGVLLLREKGSGVVNINHIDFLRRIRFLIEVQVLLTK